MNIVITSAVCLTLGIFASSGDRVHADQIHEKQREEENQQGNAI